jgi:hypothetical protein
MSAIRTRKRYRSLFKGQLLVAEGRGFRVKQVPRKVIKDYAGMNSEAARVIGFPMPPKTIYIDKNLNDKEKARTLRHELVEAQLMKKGRPYWQAHKEALKRERKP